MIVSYRENNIGYYLDGRTLVFTCRCPPAYYRGILERQKAMSTVLKRREMLQLLGAGAMSMALPGRLSAAQKDSDGKQTNEKSLTFPHRQLR